MSRILITGASGFIGKHLTHRLISEGYEVFGASLNPTGIVGCVDLTGNLSDSDFVSRIFREARPDFVIHLASKTSPGRDPADFQDQEEHTLRPALEVARAMPSSVKLGLFFGSCEEYGNGPTPFREDQAPVAFSPYGWAKISAGYGVRLLGELRGLPICWARPFLTFGPGQAPGLLIPTLIHKCLAGERIPLTPGEQTRDFLFVDDLCVMVAGILRAPAKAAGQVLNLCSGEPRKVREVAELIQKAVGRGTLAFGEVPYRTNEAMSFFGSTGKYEKLFGKPMLAPFEEAIARTVRAAQSRAQ